MAQRNSQRGSALLTALFIMTLVAIAATAMGLRIQTEIYRTRLIINRDKLYLASQAVEFWAFSVLSQKNLPFKSADKEGVLIHFPIEMEAVDGTIHVQGTLLDLQARFNLNNLRDPQTLLGFTKLLKAKFPNQDPKEARALASAIQNWISDYKLSLGRDSDTSYYMQQKPPYYPSHQPMRSLSELRLVAGVTAAIYLNLEPFVTVLPEKTAINLNTASKPVLQSLGAGLSDSEAEDLIKARGQKGFNKLSDSSKWLSKFNIKNTEVTLESEYFLSVARAWDKESELIVYRLFQRQLDKNGRVNMQRFAAP